MLSCCSDDTYLPRQPPGPDAAVLIDGVAPGPDPLLQARLHNVGRVETHS